MVDSEMTQEQLDALWDDLQKMSYLFRGAEMGKEQSQEYILSLTTYSGFTFTFDTIRKAIKLARERFNVPGQIPTVRFIMDTIDNR